LVLLVGLDRFLGPALQGLRPVRVAIVDGATLVEAVLGRKVQGQELAAVLRGGISHGGVDTVHDVWPHVAAHERVAQLVLLVPGPLLARQGLAQLRHLGFLGDLVRILRPKRCVVHLLPSSPGQPTRRGGGVR